MYELYICLWLTERCIYVQKSERECPRFWGQLSFWATWRCWRARRVRLRNDEVGDVEVGAEHGGGAVQQFVVVQPGAKPNDFWIYNLSQTNLKAGRNKFYIKNAVGYLLRCRCDPDPSLRDYILQYMKKNNHHTLTNHQLHLEVFKNIGSLWFYHSTSEVSERSERT
jgi:hypothetical protein